jgi:excisionase family DNA binding protein
MPRRTPLATSEDVAEYLQVSIRTVEDWAYRGRGPVFVMAGDQRRYRWEDVDAYLAERIRGGRDAAGAHAS